MRRLVVWTSLCILLLGSTLSRVKAQQISIAGDINSPNMLMDISLRDADLNEVLTALFNTTGGKYQLQVGSGVVGRIPRLQLVQTPFDKALDAILGTEYSYTRQQVGNGNYLYRINGRNGSSLVPDTGAIVPSMAPTTPSVPITTSSASGSSASTDTTLPTILTLTTKKTTATGATGAAAGSAATTETSVVKIIKIYYLDIPSLSSALGGTAVSLFVQSSSSTNNGYGNGTNTGMNNGMNNGSNNGYNNNNNNNNGYNNNNSGYNNNNYNNNNNNNNNRNNGYNTNNNNNNYNNTQYR